MSNPSERTDQIPGRDARLSRRRLLHVAAASGAALALPGGVALASGHERGAKRGGTLRVGIVGGGSQELLDPHKALNEMDIARGRLLFENLTDYAPKGGITNRLAADFSSNATATRWLIKLRPDVVFHDGTSFTADDVVFSLKRITDPSLKLQGAADLSFLAPKGVRKKDRLTVELTLLRPVADLRTPLASRAIQMIKAGTRSFDKPVGTGPFRLASFVRGNRSTLASFKDYRIHGGPYLAGVQLISISDASARVNALLGGQIDALVALDSKLVPTLQGNSKFRVLQSKSGGYVPQTMRVDSPPFDDVRVRQAFRLMVDRKQMVQNALGGFGSLGNDLACPFDQYYASGIAQRQYDPDRAKSLLAAAGHGSGLQVSLYTSDAAIGMLESSTLLAQQAQNVGVTISLDQVPADQYYTLKYLKAPFACSQWSQKPIDSQIQQALDSKAPYNETAWKNPAFDKLARTAQRTLDATKRKELYVEAQKILWDEGGYIIWGFPNITDAYSAKVHGLKQSSARSLGYYDFLDVTMA